jgi:FHA domain
MIRCLYCGTDNLDGSEFCDECGKKLTATAGSSSPKVMPPPPILNPQATPPPPPSFTKETITPKPATPYTPPPPPVAPKKIDHQSGHHSGKGEIYASPQNQTSAINGPTSSLESAGNPVESGRQHGIRHNLSERELSAARAKLVIQRGGKIGKEFPIISQESMIGRWDADGGIFPDIDLDQDDPEAKVSRRHARIQFYNNQFLIEDLGSTNGTFINRGPRLLPGNKQPLNNGDEIIVGKTFLKFVLY